MYGNLINFPIFPEIFLTLCKQIKLFCFMGERGGGERGGGGCEPRTCVMLCGSGSALGWSDFHFFRDFRKWSYGYPLAILL